MRIVFADDHNLVREGVMRFLNQLDESVNVAQADNYQRLMTLLSEDKQADLAIIDLGMPGVESLSQIADIVAAAGDAPVVVLSGMLDPHVVREAMKHGASGCIPKTYGGAALVNALKWVLAGEKYIPPFAPAEQSAVAAPALGDVAGPDRDILASLTQRQRQVLRHLVEGRSNRQIADEMRVTTATVKFHLKTIYAKLSVTNRTQAVRVASQSGL